MPPSRQRARAVPVRIRCVLLFAVVVRRVAQMAADGADVDIATFEQTLHTSLPSLMAILAGERGRRAWNARTRERNSAGASDHAPQRAHFLGAPCLARGVHSSQRDAKGGATAEGRTNAVWTSRASGTRPLWLPELCPLMQSCVAVAGRRGFDYGTPHSWTSAKVQCWASGPC